MGVLSPSPYTSPGLLQARVDCLGQGWIEGFYRGNYDIAIYTVTGNTITIPSTKGGGAVTWVRGVWKSAVPFRYNGFMADVDPDYVGDATNYLSAASNGITTTTITTSALADGTQVQVYYTYRTGQKTVKGQAVSGWPYLRTSDSDSSYGTANDGDLYTAKSLYNAYLATGLSQYKGLADVILNAQLTWGAAQGQTLTFDMPFSNEQRGSGLYNYFGGGATWAWGSVDIPDGTPGKCLNVETSLPSGGPPYANAGWGWWPNWPITALNPINSIAWDFWGDGSGNSIQVSTKDQTGKQYSYGYPCLAADKGMKRTFTTHLSDYWLVNNILYNGDRTSSFSGAYSGNGGTASVAKYLENAIINGNFSFYSTRLTFDTSIGGTSYAGCYFGSTNTAFTTVGTTALNLDIYSSFAGNVVITVKDANSNKFNYTLAAVIGWQSPSIPWASLTVDPSNPGAVFTHSITQVQFQPSPSIAGTLRINNIRADGITTLAASSPTMLNGLKFSFQDNGIYNVFWKNVSINQTQTNPYPKLPRWDYDWQYSQGWYGKGAWRGQMAPGYMWMAGWNQARFNYPASQTAMYPDGSTINYGSQPVINCIRRFMLDAQNAYAIQFPAQTPGPTMPNYGCWAWENAGGSGYIAGVLVPNGPYPYGTLNQFYFSAGGDWYGYFYRALLSVADDYYLSQTTVGIGCIVSVNTLNGVVQSATVTSIGKDYGVGNILRIGNGIATCVVSSVVAGGATVVTIINGGAGYSAGSFYTVCNAGSGCTLSITASGGAITGIPSPVATGFGYTTGQILGIYGGNGDAAVRVNTVDSNGGVTSVVVVTLGTGYSSGTNQTTISNATDKMILDNMMAWINAKFTYNPATRVVTEPTTFNQDGTISNGSSGNLYAHSLTSQACALKYMVDGDTTALPWVRKLLDDLHFNKKITQTGRLAGCYVTNGGSNYTAATAIITDPTGTGVTATCVVAGGKVTHVVLSGSGGGYALTGNGYTNPSIVISGDGAGATATVQLSNKIVGAYSNTHTGYELAEIGNAFGLMAYGRLGGSVNFPLTVGANDLQDCSDIWTCYQTNVGGYGSRPSLLNNDWTPIHEYTWSPWHWNASVENPAQPFDTHTDGDSWTETLGPSLMLASELSRNGIANGATWLTDLFSLTQELAGFTITGGIMGQGQFLSNPRFTAINMNGQPLAGGMVYFFTPGTTTPKNTFTDSTAVTPNANPVVLDAYGSAAIWLNGFYDVTCKDKNGNTLFTMSNVSAQYNSSNITTEWQLSPLVPVYTGVTTFTITGDVTASFAVKRRIQAVVSAGTIYGTITVSSFVSGVTTVTVNFDSGQLDSGLSSVSLGIISPTVAAPVYNGSLPAGFVMLSNMANLSAYSLIGNATAAGAAPAALTNTQALTLMSSDNVTAPTGTGAVVRGTSPTLVTPVLGTPTSGVLTNCTGVPQAQLNGDYLDDAGAVNAYTVALSPALLALADGARVRWSTVNANTTTTPTLAVNSTAATTIKKGPGAGVALAAGDIPANTVLECVYNSTATAWILCVVGGVMARTDVAQAFAGVQTFSGAIANAVAATGTANAMVVSSAGNGTTTVGNLSTISVIAGATNTGAATLNTVAITSSLTGAALLGGEIISGRAYTFLTTAAGAVILTNPSDDVGVWTPALGGSTTYTQQNGKYIRRGNLVWIQGQIIVNAIGSGSISTISGLPYPSLGVFNGAALTVNHFTAMLANYVYIVGEVDPSSTTISFAGLTAAAGATAGPLNLFQNASRIEFAGSYYIA